MSLVNDMLRDLDERKRDSTTGFRAVAKRDTAAGRWIWVALLIVFMAIVIFFMAKEWGGNTSVRSGLLSWLDKGQGVVTDNNQPVEPKAIRLDNPTVDEQESEPKQTAPVLTNVTVINWTSQSPQRGYLTFWLDEVKPFVIYRKTSMTLDIAIDESTLVAGLPDMNALLLPTIEIIPEAGKSRFKLVASAPVEFQPQLKQNPPRLVINVIGSEAKKKSPSLAVVPEPATLSVKEKVDVVLPQSKGQWKKSLNTLPTDSSTVRNARRLLGQQRTDEALELLKSYIDKTPSSLQSRYLLVQLYLATERYVAALDILQKAPDNLSWSLLKARAFLQQGQARQAIQLLEQYPEGQSQQDYLELIASGYQQAGQHAAAVARYLSLLALNPQEGRWWVSLGVSLEHLGQKSKALDAYRSALQIPDLDQTLKQYAQLQSQRLMQ